MKLYKYMNASTGLNFLENPYLRITPSNSLNDPFEIVLSDQTSQKLNQLSKEFNNQLGDTFADYLNRFMSGHGVLSLSESYDNLLMWAHYAEDHKGIVIELDIDDNDPFSLFNISSIPQSSDANFMKVNYRKTRDYQEEIKPENIENDLVQHYYQTKSDEWMYEKEWRFILPFTIANRVLVNTDFPEAHKALKYLNIPFDKKRKGVIDVTLNMNWFKSDKISHVFNESNKNGFIFLILLEETKIKRLFLGINSDISKIIPKIDSVFKGSPYIHYRDRITKKFKGVYKAERHPNRFELKFNLLQQQKETE